MVNKLRILEILNHRSVAQSGSAPALGAGGPKFESLYSDHRFRFPLEVINLFLDKRLANSQC